MNTVSSSSKALEQSSSSEMSSSSAAKGDSAGVALPRMTSTQTSLKMNVIGNNVLITGLAPNSKIAVMDMNGKVVHLRNAIGTSAIVNLSSFGRGLYLVNVRGADAGSRVNKSVKVMNR